ncbi:MAG: HAD family hydrolase [Gemmatimonadaceae bacterium]
MARCSGKGVDDVKGEWKLIAFDFDGVISDSMPGQERAWRQASRAILNNRDAEARIVENLYNGNAGQRMFDGLDLTSATLSRLRAAKDELWLAMRASTPLMTGVASALPLIAASYVVAVATTAEASYATSLLSREQIRGSVSQIVTDRDVSNPKPAPDMLLLLMKQWDVDARNMCLVGDSRTDFEMSRAAKVDFIRFASHSGAADVPAPFVSSWAELSALLLSGSVGRS